MMKMQSIGTSKLIQSEHRGFGNDLQGRLKKSLYANKNMYPHLQPISKMMAYTSMQIRSGQSSGFSQSPVA